MSRALVVSALVAVAALAGCGAGGSERDVTAVVERFEAALAADRGAQACAALTPATRAALERDEDLRCARAVLELDLPGGGQVTTADVYLTSGFAALGDRAAFLDQTPDGWRISAAGCVPTEPELPYDCELED